ncbi:hypothetical protein A8924_5783 [Saccharopolyspora erythraea NRRL 2338]|nr:hypothetical protein N599_23765 [Saccharopolyspora erythraea D]PFG98277.1 hypothetical protein A8924_5783 [Saccharopolyspora erythraea NRRL 2338]
MCPALSYRRPFRVGDQTGETVHAYGDESFHEHPDAGFYVLSAAVFEPHALDHARAVLQDLQRHHPSRKIHWTAMDDEQRRHAAKQLAGVDGLHMVVIGTPVPPRRQERARALCLARLVVELHGAGVDTLILEARHKVQDAGDVRTVAGVRHAALPRGTRFHVDHCPGTHEVLLAAADITAGACRADRLGQAEYRDVLADRIYDVCLDTGC